MHTPQIIYIGLVGLSMVVHLLKDGELMPVRKYDFHRDLSTSVIILGLLYWGGFFSH